VVELLRVVVDVRELLHTRLQTHEESAGARVADSADEVAQVVRRRKRVREPAPQLALQVRPDRPGNGQKVPTSRESLVQVAAQEEEVAVGRLQARLEDVPLLDGVGRAVACDLQGLDRGLVDVGVVDVLQEVRVMRQDHHLLGLTAQAANLLLGAGCTEHVEARERVIEDDDLLRQQRVLLEPRQKECQRQGALVARA